MLMQAKPPTRDRPIVTASSRDRPRSPVYGSNDPRYLQPAVTHGRQHHQRHNSATRAEVDRLHVASRDGRQRGEYHRTGPPPVTQKSYPMNRSNVRPDEDDMYSYTGPREQFARDYPTGPPQRRGSYSRQERPVSVIEPPEYRPGPPGRRDLGPPPSASRQLERLDRTDPPRIPRRSGLESDSDYGSDAPRRRRSVRAPVLHQGRDDGYGSSRDDQERRRVAEPRRDRPDDQERVVRQRQRDLERESARNRDKYRDSDRTRVEERPRDSERSHKPHDSRKPPRSRESSPERSGLAKGLAAVGLGGLAAELGSKVLQSSRPTNDGASEAEGSKEHRRRRRRHRDRTGDKEPSTEDSDDVEHNKTSRREDREPVEYKRGERESRGSEHENESVAEHSRRRRRRRQKDKRVEDDESDIGINAPDPAQPDLRNRDLESDDGERKHRERPTRSDREPDAGSLESRTISPGEAEDDRPRRVQLVEPVNQKEEAKPRGILKPPRAVPFPEDPNPTREGVAPLKEAGKDGVPTGARWTKISRVLVNPDALRDAHERFEERDDYVIVLRVISREEIQKLAEKTSELRGKCAQNFMADPY